MSSTLVVLIANRSCLPVGDDEMKCFNEERVYRRDEAEAVAEAWVDWMPSLTTRADLTLKCEIKDAATGERRRMRYEEELPAMVGRFVHRLNTLKGKRCGRRQPLAVLVFAERGKHGRRPHVHALLERPVEISPERFHDLIRRAWSAQPFAYKSTQIEEVRSLQQSVRYNSKSWMPQSARDRAELVYFNQSTSAQDVAA